MNAAWSMRVSVRVVSRAPAQPPAAATERGRAGAVGDRHDRVLPAGPGPGHGDRTGPPAARRCGGHPVSRGRRTGQPGWWSTSWSQQDQAWAGPDQTAAKGPEVPDPPVTATRPSVRDRLAAAQTTEPDPGAEPSCAEQARFLARRLAAAGKPVSRRVLRRGGVRGSNEALNKLACTLNAELTDGAAPPTGALIT